MNKFYCNCKYFDNIDTEEKAYWLGFIFADGWLSLEKSRKQHRYRFGIELSKKDAIQLKRFKKAIDSDAIISYRVRDGKNGVKIKLACLRIGNQDFCKRFLSYFPSGFKSRLIKFPDIAKPLVWHFIRGFFDGDGCISLNRHNRLRLSIKSNSKQFLVSIQAIIIEALQNPTAISLYEDQGKLKENNTISYVLVKEHKELTKKIIQLLYKNATVFLLRKYQLAHSR